MKDAGIQAKPETPSSQSMRLGSFEAVVHQTLNQAQSKRVIQRIWEKDASLWKDEESHRKIIANSLGWLTVPDQMLEAVDQLEAYADEIRASREFQHVMICGMGGSSLCPEVLRQTFGRQGDFPELLVLDSTDPDAIAHFQEEIDVTKCLFVIASKSGTTTEPLAFHRYWYNEVAKRRSDPGTCFVAITDPGTLMAQTAEAEGFRKIFLNPPDIGGRYSALSYFGVAPAALMGLNVKELLERARNAALACRRPPLENDAATLGAVLAECAAKGRDKLTIITDKKLSALGLWVEQLIAESTGKEGKGIVPIVGEPLTSADAYGDDRLFVSISVGASGESSSKLKALEDAGHPVVYRTLGDLNDLGAEFFVWEMATAFAGWRLGINPFDQPNVQESKDATKALLEKFIADGKLPQQSPVASEDGLMVYAVRSNASKSVAEVLREHIAKIKHGDYVALLAYVEETPEADSELQKIRMTLRDATKCATTSGYGPRFLHSTGQLHKGGPDSGVFIQITAPDKIDFEVPGMPYTFSILKDAQAQGDFESLIAHGRRAIRVDLGDDAVAGLAKLSTSIKDAVS